MRATTRNSLGIAAAVLLAVACGKTYESGAETVTLNAGTELQVSPITTLSPVTEKTGDRFTATLAAPLMKDERVIVPQGTTVMGEVVDSHAAGPDEGGSFLSLEVKQIVARGGQTVAVKTEPVRYAPAQLAEAGQMPQAGEQAEAGQPSEAGQPGEGQQPQAGQQAEGSESVTVPPVVPKDSTVTFRLAESVDMPVSLPETQPKPIS